MNRLNKLLCGIALIGLATGCSHEDIPNTGSVEKQGDVYARLALSLPSTRSQTTTDGDSNSGFEVGKDYENNVTSVLVVLAQETGGNYNYVTSALTDTKSQASDEYSPNRPMYTVTFESEEIAKFADQQVFVFAFCNPMTNLVSAVEALNVEGGANGSLNDLIGNITKDGSISEKEYFLMANQKLSSVRIPTEEDLTQKYNTVLTPFHLGTIDVSRVSARMDFRQTTKDNEGNALTAPNRFPIYDTFTSTHETPEFNEDGSVKKDEEGNVIYKTETTTGSTLMGYVTIDAMALMNEANEYYYLPRVSDDGMKTNWSICGSETSNNFVVSPNYDKKIAEQLDYSFLKSAYLYNGLGADQTEGAYNYNTFDFTLLSDVLDLDEDNDENWDADNKEGYHIWKYVTENTIPGNGLDGHDAANTIKYQRLGVTTGIVFRGYIEPTDDAEIKDQFNGVNNIYCFNGQLIGNMETLKKKVKDMPVSSIADAFYAAAKANGVTLDEDGTINPDDMHLEDFQETATTTRGEGLKIFKPKNNRYYCYYIYRNRHNDNATNYIMGPMEFAVVRNNVYKIDVQNILDFGHTEESKDDPDPEKPDDPDEPNKVYFRLQVRVLPWVVRVNHAIL